MVEILVPRLDVYRKITGDYAPSKAPVFYNPRMKLNRDIAIVAAQTYQKIVRQKLYVSEPLAGCGVRSIRFAKETEGVDIVRLNDISSDAFAMAQRNIQINNLDKIVSSSNMDANLFLSEHASPRNRFNYLDLDPFGSPVPYLDAATRSTRDGGMIALTATDMAPLCGVYPKVALRRYGGMSLRTEYCHEIAVRLLSGSLAVTAAKHNIGVEIVFSHSTDHYIRVYALATHGAKRADASMENMGYIRHCFRCFRREIQKSNFPLVQERCDKCGSRMVLAGPLWLGQIARKDFCSRMLKELVNKDIDSKSKIWAIISLVQRESEASPTYFVVDKVTDRIGIPVPSLRAVVQGLRERGFFAVPTHFNTRGVKTNAQAEEVIETIKEAAL